MHGYAILTEAVVYPPVAEVVPPKTAPFAQVMLTAAPANAAPLATVPDTVCGGPPAFGLAGLTPELSPPPPHAARLRIAPMDATETVARYFENIFTSYSPTTQSAHQTKPGTVFVLRARLSKGSVQGTFHCGDISIVSVLGTNIQ